MQRKGPRISQNQKAKPLCLAVQLTRITELQFFIFIFFAWWVANQRVLVQAQGFSKSHSLFHCWLCCSKIYPSLDWFVRSEDGGTHGFLPRDLDRCWDWDEVANSVDGSWCTSTPAVPPIWFWCCVLWFQPHAGPPVKQYGLQNPRRLFRWRKRMPFHMLLRGPGSWTLHGNKWLALNHTLRLSLWFRACSDPNIPDFITFK